MPGMGGAQMGMNGPMGGMGMPPMMGNGLMPPNLGPPTTGAPTFPFMSQPPPWVTKPDG